MRREIPRNVTPLPPTPSWDPGFSILNLLRKEVDREKHEQERVNLVMSHLSGAVTDFPHGVSRKVSRTLRKASEILHEDPEETSESDLLPRKFESSDSELIPTKKKLKLYKKRNRIHLSRPSPKPTPPPLKRKPTIPISPRLNTRIRFERRQALALHQKEGQDTSATPESSESPLLLPRAVSAFAIEESHTPQETQILEPRRAVTLPPLSLPPRPTEIALKKVRFSEGVEIIPHIRTPGTSKVRIVNDAFMRPITLLEGRLGPFPPVSDVDDAWTAMEMDAELRNGVDRIMSLPTSRFRKQSKGVGL